jgi:hypothetical protein
MVEISSTPLAENFYVADKWQKSMVKYYCDDLKKLPREVLSRPLESIAVAIENISYLNGNFPEDTLKLFKQAVGPLWDPEEYREKVYQTLMDTAKEHDEPRLITIADSLLFLRSVFEHDEAFLESHFKEQIKLMEASSYKENCAKFAKIMQAIVRVHVEQICQMIIDR